jgi:zinc protease
MANSLFDPSEVDAERTVIISERQGHENEPTFRLGEEVQAAAFRVHGYHHEVIGDMPDLQTIRREDLYQHYRTYYIPNNAVIALAGDFETGSMLDQLERLYGELPSRPEPPRQARPEPAQPGERQVTVEGPGEAIYVQASYKAPAAAHPDFLPLVVMDSLLGGASSLSITGDGLSNKTSRLYRALVETELAVGFHAGPLATVDPFLLTILAIVHPQSTAEKVIAALDGEIRKLQDVSPKPEELERAVKQARALFAYSNERITNQAFWLGFSEMIDNYRWYESYLTRLEAVTPEQVQRAAQVYLRPQNRVLGVYRPTGESLESEA